WYRKSGLAVALVFIGFFIGGILKTAGVPWDVTIGILVASWFVVWMWWHLSRRPPKTKKNHVGFVVSIHCEDDKESKKVRQDFIIPLRQLLKHSNKGQLFHFFELPQHLTSEINDIGEAEELRKKVRAHFMLYGRVRERVLDGKEHHIIELEGIVSHKPISEKTQQFVASEFAELLPRRVNILKENDLLSFKFTSEWTVIVAEYIIGIAAAISGDLDYAEVLYGNALTKLERQDQRFPIYDKLAKRIPIRISELYEARAIKVHQKWSNTYDAKFIDQLGQYLDKIAEERRAEPSVVLLSAIYAFVQNRDVQKALKNLAKLKKITKDSEKTNLAGAWNCSMAFLYAYNGNLNVAIRHYRKAAMAAVEPDIIAQVESFLCWVLEKEPEKYQLYYCLGFFNWKIKGDVVQAEKDFRAPLKTPCLKEICVSAGHSASFFGLFFVFSRARPCRFPVSGATRGLV
ncbi:MAG TPA: hypothetical protein VI588_03675, partial [Candidatus Gracilibacteria bacterium]|nr:hypothetical protein [Candidatus Gracilibacteria bacterium]